MGFGNEKMSGKIMGLFWNAFPKSLEILGSAIIPKENGK